MLCIAVVLSKVQKCMPLFKGQFTQKSTHPYVVPNLYEFLQKKRFRKMLVELSVGSH